MRAFVPVILVLSGFSRAASAADPFIGRWQLDQKQSYYDTVGAPIVAGGIGAGPPAPHELIMTIKPVKDHGHILWFEVRLRGARGQNGASPIDSETQLHFDGVPNPTMLGSDFMGVYQRADESTIRTVVRLTLKGTQNRLIGGNDMSLADPVTVLESEWTVLKNTMTVHEKGVEISTRSIPNIGPVYGFFDVHQAKSYHHVIVFQRH